VTAASSGTAVVIDTMAVSALINPDRSSSEAAEFRDLVGGRVTVVSFMTVTELRYGALKAGWGEFRRRGLERDLDQFTVVEPDDEMMQLRAALRARCERVGHGLGQKIHEADRWIAAAALRLRIPLVSDDSIFAGVDGLPVESRGARSN
jgi:predicted nucleic acid-binding protein